MAHHRRQRLARSTGLGRGLCAAEAYYRDRGSAFRLPGIGDDLRYETIDTIASSPEHAGRVSISVRTLFAGSCFPSRAVWLPWPGPLLHTPTEHQQLSGQESPPQIALEVAYLRCFRFALYYEDNGVDDAGAKDLAAEAPAIVQTASDRPLSPCGFAAAQLGATQSARARTPVGLEGVK